MKRTIFLGLTLIFTQLISGQNYPVRIATWNIEHMGSPGRGFPEHVWANIGPRTNTDLEAIASLIRDTLELDIVCVQEVAISGKQNGKSSSVHLEKLTELLGSSWKYYLTYTLPENSEEDQMQNAFLYNGSVISLASAFEMPVPKIVVGEKSLFDRLPLVGHFIVSAEELDNNEFVIVNLHLASGQDNDENHLAAMVIVEQNLNNELKDRDILEKRETGRYALEEKIILGDFNDNPYALKSNGECCQYLDLMYDYMEKRQYTDLVTKDVISTRMNANYNSIIDHVMIHRRLKNELTPDKLRIYQPCDPIDNDCLLNFRRVYSDHFPLYFTLDFRD
jgi:endonuclease/exonuclease/phosphatase family metal-dependent hydrolase